MSTSLSSLQNLSMVTLGFSALTPFILGVQFTALNRRLSAMQRQIAGLHRKLDAEQIANLKAGLGLLQMALDVSQTHGRVAAGEKLNDALPLCLKSTKYFAQLLGTELNLKYTNPLEVRLLARHMSVAAAGVASCQIALEQDRLAFSQLEPELALLKSATRRVFHKLVADNPGPYLLPAMADFGVTLECMVELFRQARDAGAVDLGQRLSAAGWFEEHRKEICRAKMPLLPTKKWYKKLLAQLREATSMIEETNRVCGLSRLVEEAQTTGHKTLDVWQEINSRAKNHPEAPPLTAWAFA